MVTRMAWIPFHGTYEVDTTKEPYNPEIGTVRFTARQPSDIHDPDERGEPVLPTGQRHVLFHHYLDIASIANVAVVKKIDGPESGKRWEINGDPTEVAIQVFAARFGSFGLSSNAKFSRLAEFPFDSSVKKMSMLCSRTTGQGMYIFTKGAVERVLESCSSFAQGTGTIAPISDEFRTTVYGNVEAMARCGLRVLALADGPVTRSVSEGDIYHGKLARHEFEQDLVFRGLVAIYDPPRPESRPSVLKCHRAGVQVHMLTGDHPETARCIALEVGILPSISKTSRADATESLVMAAHDFDALTDEDVDKLPELPLVVARCAPSTKVRMIEALHRRGRYVAMTGDGVNDSPSLKRADIGIAMGQCGSDVAKSAADIVLSDDNFASILNAVEEGRRIFDNVQKFILHVLAANVGFVATLLIGLVYKDSSGTSIFQVTPVEILFMLLVAGAFTETGLGFEAASPDILRRPPHNVSHNSATTLTVILHDLTFTSSSMAYSLLNSPQTCLHTASSWPLLC